jgi:hypothetical protein
MAGTWSFLPSLAQQRERATPRKEGTRLGVPSFVDVLYLLLSILLLWGSRISLQYCALHDN